MFEMENIELTFVDEALSAVARKATERKTGARGLRSCIRRHRSGLNTNSCSGPVTLSGTAMVIRASYMAEKSDSEPLAHGHAAGEIGVESNFDGRCP